MRVTVFEQESLTNTYSVDQSGYIAFPLVGAVPARGHTVQQLEGEIAGKLRNGYLRDPDVSVEIDRYRPIFVMGEVGAAGQYSYVPGMTVQKAIAAAGGFSPRANQDNVDITRDINGKVMTGRVVDIGPAAAGRHRLCPRTPVLIAHRPALRRDTETQDRPLLPLAGRRHFPACARPDRGAGRRRPRGRHRLRFDHRRRFRGEACSSEMAGQLALGVRRTPMQRHIGPGDIASAWRTYRIIKELRPDVLHGHGAKGGVYARLFGSLLRVSRSRVARLYSPHGGSLHYDETTPTGKLFFALERLMAALHRPSAVRLRL